MTWRPQLNVVCGRCGKPRGLTHVCISGRTRKATARPQFGFGTCPQCEKPQGNPMTHTCHPRSDFKRRRSAHHKQQATDKRAQAASIAKIGRSRQRGPAKRKHNYLTCTDGDCQRPLCVAFKTGYKTGHREGYEHGWQQGYDRGFTDGIAACPRSHK
jgi:hypothetical protein